jgi:hypothetical protein
MQCIHRSPRLAHRTVSLARLFDPARYALSKLHFGPHRSYRYHQSGMEALAIRCGAALPAALPEDDHALILLRAQHALIMKTRCWSQRRVLPPRRYPIRRAALSAIRTAGRFSSIKFVATTLNRKNGIASARQGQRNAH